MYTIQQTSIFAEWLAGLRDLRAKAAIVRRLAQAMRGNLGDVKSASESVLEMRIDIGPGYRIYFVRRGQILILILCGGDKSSQTRDIKLAHQLARELAS
ncbi:MAG: type II toxin-antitoxin system RelE/ParE family toxin [Magnetococcales bacterium]|nr:type II toxin-antitoxin system RelE/ParE family toxin [Magnetococcales bacterium]